MAMHGKMDSARAYAKINLHLEVLNKRNDGYHEIFSLMAAVGLHDLLKLEKLDVSSSRTGRSAVEIVSEGGSNASLLDEIPQKDNIITKAALKYFDEAGISGYAVFRVTKNIPSGAGMAGGSSDAAAALKLINRKLERFDDNQLMNIGSGIGANVPFCLCGGFALCTGIGEKVSPIPGKLDHHVVIANNGTHINTAEAYRSLGRTADQLRDTASLRQYELIMRNSLESGSIGSMKDILHNDFEEPVFRNHPGLKEIKDRFISLGAAHSAMTGSGSSIVGLFDDKAKAVAAKQELEKTVKQVIITGFLNDESIHDIQTI